MSALIGNKLEKDLYCKLQEPSLLASLKVDGLKVDGLMFYFVYADLVNLAKSTELNKSVYDMRNHYLELKIFLDELEKHPAEITMNREYRVFVSEQRLYGASKVNHRHSKVNSPIKDCLFVADSFDEIVFLKISIGVAAMKKRLMEYASTQLPGGEFWDPSPDIKSVLLMLKPTNIYASLFSDLMTTFPHLFQIWISLQKVIWLLLRRIKQCSG